MNRTLVQTLAVIVILGAGVWFFQRRQQPAPAVPDKLHLPSPEQLAARETLISVDYPALWKQHVKEPDPLVQVQQRLGLMRYATEPRVYFAAELVASGRAGPIALASRVQAQPEVVKVVQAATKDSMVVVSSFGGAMYDNGHVGFPGGGSRKLILIVNGTPQELDRSLRGFGEAVAEVPRKMGGDVSSAKTGGTPYPHSEFSYKLPERTGTFSARLLLPDAKKEVVDGQIPPDDAGAQVVVKARKPDQSLLVVTVEEK